MQFCVLMEKIDKRRNAKAKHLAFTYVTKNNEQEAIFVGADGCFFFLISLMLRTLERCFNAKIKVNQLTMLTVKQ